MTVSKVIERLRELQKQVGFDVDVEMYMEDIDGTQCGVDEITDINFATDEHNENPTICIAHFNNKEEN